MQYLGGKARTSKDITRLLNQHLLGRDYLEPFVGGLWVLQDIAAEKRTASDNNRSLISLYTSLQRGWTPPTEISEELYNKYRITQDESDPLTAFIGIGCSFSGKWFGGYARSNGRNYALNAYNSLMRKLPKIRTTRFLHCDYTEHRPTNMLVYCDPPYEGTTGYREPFNSQLFWDIMREWRNDRSNTVVVSEYSAPKDFKCVLEIPTKTDMRVGGNKERRVEKLFM